jgi:hypothetical protein
MIIKFIFQQVYGNHMATLVYTTGMDHLYGNHMATLLHSTEAWRQEAANSDIYVFLLSMLEK